MGRIRWRKLFKYHKIHPGKRRSSGGRKEHRYKIYHATEEHGDIPRSGDTKNEANCSRNGDGRQGRRRIG
jgi:hypothetical protein